MQAAIVSNMQDLFLMPVIPLPKDHKDGLWPSSSGLKLSALEKKKRFTVCFFFSFGHSVKTNVSFAVAVGIFNQKLAAWELVVCHSSHHVLQGESCPPWLWAGQAAKGSREERMMSGWGTVGSGSLFRVTLDGVNYSNVTCFLLHRVFQSCPIGRCSNKQQYISFP